MPSRYPVFVNFLSARVRYIANIGPRTHIHDKKMGMDKLAMT